MRALSSGSDSLSRAANGSPIFFSLQGELNIGKQPLCELDIQYSACISAATCDTSTTAIKGLSKPL
eukprot:6607-Heterococcus_DN1.PRE.2